MAGPIKPGEITDGKVNIFPDAVWEAFNELIVQEFNEGVATVGQREVVALMIKKGLRRPDIFTKGWLNIEDAYRAVGWIVEYDKPAYNESYEATFTFKKKKR